MYVVNNQNDRIRQYTMTTPYDWSTASVASTLSLASYDNNPRDITITSDGKKAYIIGNTNKKIHELVLVTPFDITTAYWTGVEVNLNIAAGTAGYSVNPVAISTSGNGEFLYVYMHNQGIIIYQLSTLFELSTASYFGKQDFDATYIDMSFDGTRIFAVSGPGANSNYFVSQYRVDNTTATPILMTTSNLHIANAQLSTMTTDYQSLANGSNYNYGFTISDNGSHLYLIDYDTIRYFTLSSPYNISTATLSHSRATYPSDTSYRSNGDYGLAISSNGQYLYVVNNQNDRIRQYTMTTPYDWSTASVASTLSLASYDNNPRDITITSDGKKAYIIGNTNKKIHELVLATPFDISTAYWTGVEIYLPNIGSSISINNPTNIDVSGNGQYLYVHNHRTGIVEIELSTAFDLSTATHSSTITGSDEVIGNYAHVSHDGSKLYTSYGSFITQHRVDNTIGTQVAVTPSGTWSMTTGLGTPTVVQTDTIAGNYQDGFAISEDGLHLYIINYDNIEYYTLTSAYDLSTVALSYTYSTYPSDTGYRSDGDYGLEISSNGQYLYVANDQNDQIRQYTMSTPYNLSTASLTSTMSTVAFDATVRDITMTPDGKKAYMVGSTSKKVHELALVTPFDITTAYWTGVDVYLPGIGSSIDMTNPTMVKISGTGEYLYAISVNGYTEISLSTPFDLTTAAYSSYFDWSAVGGTYGTLNSDGSKLITHKGGFNNTWTTYTT